MEQLEVVLLSKLQPVSRASFGICFQTHMEIMEDMPRLRPGVLHTMQNWYLILLMDYNYL